MNRSTAAGQQQGVLSWRLLRATGYVLVVQGLCLLAVGLADVIYTAIEYTTAQKCDSTEKMAALNTLINPCDNDDVLVYTWVASPVWSSLVVIATGGLGSSLSHKYHRSKKQITAYLVVASITAGLFCPCTIVLSALEINAGKDVFIHGDVTSELDIKDTAKFALPLLSAILALLVAIVCVVLMFHICISKAPPLPRDLYGDNRRYTHREKFRGKWDEKKKKSKKNKKYANFNGYDNRSFAPHHQSTTMQPQYNQRMPYQAQAYYPGNENGYRQPYPNMHPSSYSLPTKNSHYTRQDGGHRDRRYPRNGAREPNGYYMSHASSYNGSIPNGRKAHNLNEAIDDMFDFRDVARSQRDSFWERPVSRH